MNVNVGATQGEKRWAYGVVIKVENVEKKRERNEKNGDDSIPNGGNIQHHILKGSNIMCIQG